MITTQLGPATLTWIPTSDLDSYHPITQVYGVCFDTKGQILVIKQNQKWQIPGGSTELGERPIETLIRELKEEADVTLKNIQPLGVQKVDYPNNPNQAEGELLYQARFYAEIEKLMPQTPDPDGGLIHPRDFVSIDTIEKYVKWGEIGHDLFTRAYAFWQKSNR